MLVNMVCDCNSTSVGEKPLGIFKRQKNTSVETKKWYMFDENSSCELSSF